MNANIPSENFLPALFDLITVSLMFILFDFIKSIAAQHRCVCFLFFYFFFFFKEEIVPQMLFISFCKYVQLELLTV